MKKTKLTFSGDIILDNETISLYKVEKEKFDFNNMFTNTKKFLSQSDFVVGNLETPITTSDEEIKYQPYTFTSPLEFAEAVKNAGFDLVTTANNHCLDNGIEGVKKTIDGLNKIRT